MPSNITLSKENITFPYQETGYAHKCFPVRNIRRFKPDDGGAWLIEYKIEKERQLDALNRINDDVHQKKVLKSPKKVKEFTGSFLTKEFHLDEPSALFSINISGKQLHRVKDEDFSSFENVLYIEAGDNHLHFETFKSFPKLEELHLEVNGISDIGITHKAFQYLKRLDLSYNHLKDNALLSLGKLRNVKELTLRGCSLTNLPADLARGYLVSEVNDEHKFKSEQKSRFPQLEHLDLSENKLTDLSTFASLAGLRKLKTLNLSSNKICGIPHLRLLVAHRHFSASTCTCKSPAESQLANIQTAFNGDSVENITKAKEFCTVSNVIGVVAAPSDNSSTEVAKNEDVWKNEAEDENLLKKDSNVEHKDRDLNDTNNIINDDSVKDLCDDAFPDKNEDLNSNNSDKNVTDEILFNDTVDNTQQLTDIGDPNDIKVGESDTSNTEVDADNLNKNISVNTSSDIVVSDETDCIDIRITINEVIGDEDATNITEETAGSADSVTQEESAADELTEEEGTSDKIIKTTGFCKLDDSLEETITNEITLTDAKDKTSTQVFENIMESMELDEEFEKLMNIEPLEENDALFATEIAEEINFTLNSMISEDNSKNINEDTDDYNGGFPNSGEDLLNEDDNLRNPFSSLKMLDLSHNLITEEAALLALTAWPVLQDLKVWGNPLMQAFKGIPPIISHHLQKMCGMNVHSKLPQVNHMHHSIGPSIAKSAKTYRVKTNLPPIKRNNMLLIEAAIHKAVEDSEREKEEPSLVDTEELQNENGGGEGEDHDIKKSSQEEVDYNETEGIFLTQVDEDAEVPAMEETERPKQLPEEDEAVNPKYKGYEELLMIDETYGPESDIHIPSTVYGSVQALRQMLKNPLVFKEGNYNRKSRLNPEGQKEKKIKSAPTRKKKEDKISEALEFIRTKETTYQENLATVLNQYTSNEMKEKFPDAKKIVKRVQEKYDQVRLESLRPISIAPAELSRMSTRADKRSQDLILLRMKQGRIGDLYSSPRNTCTSGRRVTSPNVTHSAK